MYLYLTTTGRVTGQAGRAGKSRSGSPSAWRALLPCCLSAGSANWVRNIQSWPQVKVRVGDAGIQRHIARVVHDDREPQLAATVKALFDAKYGRSDGLIAEPTPA